MNSSSFHDSSHLQQVSKQTCPFSPLHGVLQLVNLAGGRVPWDQVGDIWVYVPDKCKRGGRVVPSWPGRLGLRKMAWASRVRLCIHYFPCFSRQLLEMGFMIIPSFQRRNWSLKRLINLAELMWLESWAPGKNVGVFWGIMASARANVNRTRADWQDPGGWVLG